MQTISRRRLADYLATELHNGASVKQLAKMTAAYLIEQRQTKELDLLVKDLKAALQTKFGVVSTEVTSARKLNATLREQITAFVKEVEEAKQVVITDEAVDEDLIAGVTIATPQGFFDGSVRNKLQQLQAMTKE